MLRSYSLGNHFVGIAHYIAGDGKHTPHQCVHSGQRLRAVLHFALICASMLTILGHHRVYLLTLFWVTQKAEPGASSRAHWWIRTLIVLAVSAIMISGAILQHYVKG